MNKFIKRYFTFAKRQMKMRNSKCSVKLDCDEDKQIRLLMEMIKLYMEISLKTNSFKCRKNSSEKCRV